MFCLCCSMLLLMFCDVFRCFFMCLHVCSMMLNAFPWFFKRFWMRFNVFNVCYAFKVLFHDVRSRVQWCSMFFDACSMFFMCLHVFLCFSMCFYVAQCMFNVLFDVCSMRARFFQRFFCVLCVAYFNVFSCCHKLPCLFCNVSMF